MTSSRSPSPPPPPDTVAVAPAPQIAAGPQAGSAVPVSRIGQFGPLVVAFVTGGLLSLMVLFNGTLGAEGGALFASWSAHGTGTVAASLFLGVFALAGRRAAPATLGRPPLWAYLGGVSGAVTVMLTSVTLNTALALSGTLALGLLGQVAFGLVADRFGLFGLPKRWPGVRDLAALALILTGSGCIIFSTRIAALSGLAP